MKTITTLTLIWILGLASFAGEAMRSTDTATVELMETPSGVKFGLRGLKTKSPLPLLLNFAGEFNESLTEESLAGACEALVTNGWRVASLDLPSHGEEIRKGETPGLPGWRERMEKGEDPMIEFCKRGSAVLDHLVKTGLADSERIGALGISRGGFAALHLAASDRRIRWVVAVAPLTRLTVPVEFANMQENKIIQKLSVFNCVEKLVGRSVWLCIGNHDRRVGTEETVEFSRALVATNLAHKVPADVELHVYSYDGHTSKIENFQTAAIWLSAHAAMTSDDKSEEKGAMP